MIVHPVRSDKILLEGEPRRSSGGGSHGHVYCMDSHQENTDFSHTHRIYVWYIYLYLQSAIHVGKYTLRPMDPGIGRICPQRFRMAISPITELKGGSTVYSDEQISNG